MLPSPQQQRRQRLAAVLQQHSAAPSCTTPELPLLSLPQSARLAKALEPSQQLDVAADCSPAPVLPDLASHSEASARLLEAGSSPRDGSSPQDSSSSQRRSGVQRHSSSQDDGGSQSDGSSLGPDEPLYGSISSDASDEEDEDGGGGGNAADSGAAGKIQILDTV